MRRKDTWDGSSLVCAGGGGERGWGDLLDAGTERNEGAVGCKTCERARRRLPGRRQVQKHAYAPWPPSSNDVLPFWASDTP